jgi:uncharacterized membrane protein
VAIEDQAETETEGEAEESGTGRLEAFSDGVFAIAVTLLVLQLKVPDVPFKKSLASFVVDQWPAFVAYFNSFLSILIMWLNHHNIFKLIRRSNHTFIIFNGVLLMLITFINYPTALLAAYLKPDTPGASPADQKFATLIYTGTFVIIAVFYNVLWRYGTYNGRLLGKHANKALVAQITREYRFGPLVYLVAFLLAFVSVPASLVLTVLLAVYFALSGRNRSGKAPESQGMMP